MKSPITSLDPVTIPLNAKTILSSQGFACTLLTLAPGDETPRYTSERVEEHLLFVIEGEATVRFDGVNTVLNQDEALLIPKGQEHVITAHTGAWAKILRVDVPPRQVVEPQIISFD